MNIAISGTAVAWYAALVSTASLAIGVGAFLRDRPRLIARLAKDMSLTEPYGDYKTGIPYLATTIANRGRRPITIDRIWFTHATSVRSLLVISSLRRGATEIGEGKSATYLTAQDSLPLSELTEIRVVDATGQVWRGQFEVGQDIRLRVLTKRQAAKDAAALTSHRASKQPSTDSDIEDS